jgi:hypothetical protein
VHVLLGKLSPAPCGGGSISLETARHAQNDCVVVVAAMVVTSSARVTASEMSGQKALSLGSLFFFGN